jgi:hypothetical protein
MKLKIILPFLLLFSVFSPVIAQSDFQTEWIIDIQKSGEAQITIKISIPVSSQEEWNQISSSLDESAFISYQQLISEVVESASQRTGRAMQVHSWSVEKDFLGDHGEIKISFVWENFCTLENGKLNLSDVLDDLYIPEGYILKIRTPEGMSFSDIQPSPDVLEGNTAIYFGPKTMNIQATIIETRESPGFELLSLLVAVFIVFYILRRN